MKPGLNLRASQQGCQTVIATVALSFEVTEGSDTTQWRGHIEQGLGRLLDTDDANGASWSGFEVGTIRARATNRTHVLCSTCGSTDVNADAFAALDVNTGAWVLNSVYDAKTCDTCGTSCSVIDVDEAAGLEIQAFAMVEDTEGARQAEDGEAASYFDVMVTTCPMDDGQIHVLAEHEDLSHAEMESVLHDMQKTYPLAPVVYHFRDVWPS